MLFATFIARWAPLTAYALGTKVVSPSGVRVNAKAAFTCGAAYSGSDWSLPTDFISFIEAPLDVRRFEAVLDGATSNSAALRAAINALPARGGRLRLPAELLRNAEHIVIAQDATTAKAILWHLSQALRAANITASAVVEGIIAFKGIVSRVP